MLFAMAFEKALKKGETTYLAALTEVKPDVHIEVPNNVAKLLEEFEDVMQPDPPKEFSLGR